MTTTTWQNAAGGNFDTASNWTDGVPITGSTALITASGTYTVASSQTNSIAALEMAARKSLAINADFLSVTSGTGTGALAGKIMLADMAALNLGAAATDTTFDNTGTIEFQSVADPTNLGIDGTVTLIGNGKITLSGLDSHIGYGAAAGSTLINGNTSSGNTISGTGVIGDGSVSLVNAAKGTIDSTDLIIIDTKSFTNSGLMEAIGTGALYFQSAINQTANGQIKAASSGAMIDLDAVNIVGGAISLVGGSVLNSLGGQCQILSNTAIANAGIIEDQGADLYIGGSVKNTAGGTLSAYGGHVLNIAGTVTGGKADIGEGHAFLAFGGPSSAKVTFEAGSTGTLNLGDATQFTGTVAGLSTNPGSRIELENIGFADDPMVHFNAANHLLTVTDPVTNVTDKIKIVGTGTFTDTNDINGQGDTDIIASPANAAHAQKNAQLLLQAIGSFAVPTGLSGSSSDNLSDHYRAPSDLVAVPHRE